MVMSASELVRRNPQPTEGEVRHWLEGNLCRCTGYHNIVAAVLSAAEAMRGSAPTVTPKTVAGGAR
jgi:carbon-monoxide dehydrogenase small subunit